MGLEQAGVALIAQGASAYISDMKSATGATDTFVGTTDKGSGIVGRAGDMMGSAIKSVASIAAGVGVAGFLALGKAIIDGVGDAREAAQLLAQTNAVITSTGGAAERSAEQITDLATALSASQGASLFGDSDVQAAENLLLTFTNIKGAVFDAATAISVDMAQALGGAPKDQAIALGKALNDPIQGVTALTRVGVTFTDQQKEQIKAMQEAGDMAGAQKIILAELNKEFGGSAKAAAIADGGWAQIKDTLGELAESVGAAVLPILGELADWLNSPAVKKGAADFADALIVGFGWIHDNIPPIINLVLGVFDDLQGSLDENAAFFDQSFSSIENIVTDVASIVQITLAALAGFIDEHGATIQRILSNTWESIKSVIDIALALIEGTVKTTLQLLQGDWSGAWETIKGMSARIVTDLWTIISGGLDNLLALFQDLTGNVQQSWNDMIDDALSAGADIVQGIIDGVEGAAGQLMSTLQNLAADALQAAKDALGISSPSKQFAAIGQYSIIGLIDGIGDMLPSLISTATQIATDMMAALTKNVEKGKEDLTKELNRVLAAINDVTNQIQETIADSFGATASVDRQMASNLSKLSKMADDFYKEAATRQLQAASDQAKAFADPAVGAEYYKMRSKQIFEFMDLQKQINAETNADTKASLQQQQRLILNAQQAEIDQFNAQQANNTSPSQDISAQLSALLSNKLIPGITENPVITQLFHLLEQLRNAPGRAGGGSVNAFQPYWVGEHGKELFWPTMDGMVSPVASSQQMAARSNTTNYYGNVGPQVSMPIYTNNSPAALQQSWAIMQASMV